MQSKTDEAIYVYICTHRQPFFWFHYSVKLAGVFSSNHGLLGDVSFFLVLTYIKILHVTLNLEWDYSVMLPINFAVTRLTWF